MLILWTLISNDNNPEKRISPSSLLTCSMLWSFKLDIALLTLTLVFAVFRDNQPKTDGNRIEKKNILNPGARAQNEMESFPGEPFVLGANFAKGVLVSYLGWLLSWTVIRNRVGVRDDYRDTSQTNCLSSRGASLRQKIQNPKLLMYSPKCIFIAAKRNFDKISSWRNYTGWNTFFETLEFRARSDRVYCAGLQWSRF